MHGGGSRRLRTGSDVTASGSSVCGDQQQQPSVRTRIEARRENLKNVRNAGKTFASVTACAGAANTVLINLSSHAAIAVSRSEVSDNTYWNCNRETAEPRPRDPELMKWEAERRRLAEMERNAQFQASREKDEAAS
jgi:hypothetical protein